MNSAEYGAGDKGQVGILTMNELDRIRNTVNPRARTPGSLEKEHLKKLSDERANKWPNTLEAARARKERMRTERLDQEEGERCEIDRQEALIKAENRRLQIERANKMLYDETDRVKAFHGKLLLSDVIQEREMQKKYKAKLKEVQQRQDDEYHKDTLRALEAAEEAEMRKMADTKRRAMDQRDAQLTQLEELKDRIISEKLTDKQEGELLKKKAYEAVEMLKKREFERVQKNKRVNLETEKANEALLKIKALEVQREREEEQRIMEFAKRKEQLILERKMREETKQKDKDERKSRMVKRMEGDLLTRRLENERVAQKQAIEAQDKEEQEELRRAEVKRLEMEAIDRSRAQQAQIKSGRRERARAEDIELTAQMKLREEMGRLEEEEERAQQYVRNKHTQRVHLKQMEKKRNKAVYDTARERAEAEATRLILAEDDELFKQYTAVCMDEWAADGKTLKPMQLEIAKQNVHRMTQFAASS